MKYLIAALTLALFCVLSQASEPVKEYKEPDVPQYPAPTIPRLGGGQYFPWWHTGYFGGGYPYNGFPYYPAAYPQAYPPAYPPPAYPYYRGVPHPAPRHYGYEMKFRGKFDGTCDNKKDGLYFVDDRSFAYCSGGIKTIQACADGSANPGYDEFINGKYSYIYDFCSVNLAAKNKI